MGLKDIAKRLRATIDEIDDERLQDRFAGLGLTPIAELQARTPVRVGGEVTRTRITPRSGIMAYEITISDGTGDVVAVFTGRRYVPGLEHHRGVLVEGVARGERGKLVLLNPAYTLLPHH